MRRISNSLMIFAAGFGTRMAPLSNHTPKPLIKVANRTLLDHTLALAKQASVPNIVVNTHYKAAQIATHLQGSGIQISYEDEILDTGGGLKHAAPLLAERCVFTLNSDGIWRGQNPLVALSQQWHDTMGALLLCADITQVLGRRPPGDFDCNAKMQARRKGDYVYLGAQIINLNHITAWPHKVFSLNAVWDHLIAEKKLYIYIYNGQWCDVGQPNNIKTAERLLKDGNV